MTLVDVLQVVFCHAHRHRLFVVYPREIVIIDTEARYQIGTVLLERNASPFRQVSRTFPC